MDGCELKFMCFPNHHRVWTHFYRSNKYSNRYSNKIIGNYVHLSICVEKYEFSVDLKRLAGSKRKVRGQIRKWEALIKSKINIILNEDETNEAIIQLEFFFLTVHFIFHILASKPWWTSDFIIYAAGIVASSFISLLLSNSHLSWLVYMFLWKKKLAKSNQCGASSETAILLNRLAICFFLFEDCVYLCCWSRTRKSHFKC